MEDTIDSCPEIRFFTLKSNTCITFALFFITSETNFFNLLFDYFLGTSRMIHLYRCNSFVGKKIMLN